MSFYPYFTHAGITSYKKISISEVTLKYLRAIAVVCWTHADVSIGRIGSPRPENRKVTQMLAHCTQLSQPGPFAMVDHTFNSW